MINHDREAALAAAAADSERARRRRRKAPIAAFWSFVFPGGGQLYNHQPRLAAAFATPIALLVLGLIAAVVLLGDALLPRLLDTRIVIGLIVLNAAVLGWRLVAMLQAHRRRARLRPNRIGTLVTTGLIVVTLVMHAVPATYALKLLETLSAVSQGGRQTTASDGDALDGLPGIFGPGREPLLPPSAQPEGDRGERINILLVGVDSGVGRDHALTDTMLVVSMDPDGETAMLSIPRDLVDAPLPNGEPYPNKINSLLQTANADQAGYPFGGGVTTLKLTVGNLLGVPIHYFAAVDMVGFRQLIDSVGGVMVNVDPAVADASLQLYLDAGPTDMDGQLALAYVRSRHGVGNNDFVRANRQQQVLAAVRDKLTQTNLLISLPVLLDAVQSTVATDVPSHRIPQLAEIIQNADMANMQRAVIEPPLYVTPATGAGGAYILIPDLVAIRELGQELAGN